MIVSSLARKTLDNAADVKSLLTSTLTVLSTFVCGAFFGLAHEAQLKILELTAGSCDMNPVGFRRD